MIDTTTADREYQVCESAEILQHIQDFLEEDKLTGYIVARFPLPNGKWLTLDKHTGKFQVSSD